jgi:hypothetical protein
VFGVPRLIDVSASSFCASEVAVVVYLAEVMFRSSKCHAVKPLAEEREGAALHLLLCHNESYKRMASGSNNISSSSSSSNNNNALSPRRRFFSANDTSSAVMTSAAAAAGGPFLLQSPMRSGGDGDESTASFDASTTNALKFNDDDDDGDRRRVLDLEQEVSRLLSVAEEQVGETTFGTGLCFIKVLYLISCQFDWVSFS